MWQDRLLHCVVFTKTSEEFAPHYLAEIRHDIRQTTLPPVLIGMEACGGAHYWARRFRGSCTFRERIIPALRKTGKIPS
jgi:hypothetical protein